MCFDPFLTLDEAARLFQVSHRTAYRRIRSGEWPAVRDGGHWLLRESWILAELQTRQGARDGDELAHDAEIRDRVLSGRRAGMNSSTRPDTGPGFVNVRRRRRHEPAHLNWLDQRPQGGEGR